MSKNNTCLTRFGDDCLIRYPNETIDCTRLGYFDELEYDCWNLVKKYCEHFGFELLNFDDDDNTDPISFDVAKGIQDLILKEFEYAGIKFDYETEG